MAQKTVREVLNDAYQGQVTYRGVFDFSAKGNTAVVLEGVAGFIVRLKVVHVDVPAGDLTPLAIIKYSTLVSGGTRTTPAGIPLDSRNPPARAVFGIYTAAPTAGTPVGTLFNDDILARSIVADQHFRGDRVHEEFGTGDSSQAVVLHTDEYVGLVPTGASNPLVGYIEWTEEPDNDATPPVS